MQLIAVTLNKVLIKGLIIQCFLLFQLTGRFQKFKNSFACEFSILQFRLDVNKSKCFVCWVL